MRKKIKKRNVTLAGYEKANKYIIVIENEKVIHKEIKYIENTLKKTKTKSRIYNSTVVKKM